MRKTPQTPISRKIVPPARASVDLDFSDKFDEHQIAFIIAAAKERGITPKEWLAEACVEAMKKCLLD